MLFYSPPNSSRNESDLNLIPPKGMNVTAALTAEFAFYGAWEGLCSLLGISGNLILLYTFLLYPRAIQLDLVSVTIMKNLAVVDLISALFIPSTLSVSYIAGRGVLWPLSRTWCYIYTYMKHGPTVAAILFIMSFSIYRLFRCCMPLRSRDVNERNIAITATVTVWGITILVPVYMMYFHLTKHLDIQFLDGETQYGTCDFVDVLHPEEISARPKAVLALVIILIPCIITVSTNTALLVYILVKTEQPTIRLRTTVFVTTIFIICYFPYGAIIFVSSTTRIVPGRVIRHLAARFVSVGCWYNLPTYLFLDRKLRFFMREMFAAAMRCEKVLHPASPLPYRIRFKGAATGITAAIAMSKTSHKRVMNKGLTAKGRMSVSPLPSPRMCPVSPRFTGRGLTPRSIRNETSKNNLSILN